MRGRGNKKTTKYGRTNTQKPSPKMSIYINIKKELVKKIEENISGKSRSQKIAKCAEVGYIELNKNAGVR